MELRSTRSRSKSRSSMDKDVIISENHVKVGVGQTIVRTTRSSTVKMTTISSDDNSIANINHNSESHVTRPVKMKTEKSIRKTRYKTSDYSSEDGENQVSSSETSQQNSRNQFLENTRRSVSRSTGSVSAIDYYRAAGDYWNKYPKTDYTYSPHSRDRQELAPGVLAMPNMSRKSLHSYDSNSDYVLSHNKQTNTEIINNRDETDYTSKSAYSLRSSKFNSEDWSNVRPRTLFSNNNNHYYSSKTSSVQKRSLVMRIITTVTSIFLSIFNYIVVAIYGIYQKQNSVFVWFGKQIHQVATRIMYWDTWLLQSSNNKRKLRWLMALCLIPLLIFGGLHVLLASGVPLAPPCHPHCGRIASSYINSYIDSAYDALHYFKT